MNRPLIKRAVRFGVSGVFVTGCHSAYAVTAIELNGWTPPTANGFAFTFATLVSYLINTRWSFACQASSRTFLRFWMVCGVGLMQSIALSTAVEQAGYSYPVGIGLIALTVPPVSFTLHSLWTYRGVVPVAAVPVIVPTRPPCPSARARIGGKLHPKSQRGRRRPYQRFSR
ncbi:GtrA family protein [Methylomagnum sp.]